MEHLQPYASRSVFFLPTAEVNGWQLKQYVILAKDKVFDPLAASSALDAAAKRLPSPGKLSDPSGNHGVGIQLIHFAEVAVVSPVFYWLWGSVLANTHQMRAQWKNSSNFETGVKEVVGCVWEMEILCFEAQSWKDTMLKGTGNPENNLSQYLKSNFPSAEPISKIV